jgi:hypothetical protein
VLLGIDHVAIATADPEASAAELERKLGLAATGGGRHEALGTFNRLIWLGDSYLELIGVFDTDLARSSWLGAPVLEAIERGGGLVTWVIAVDDVEETLRWGPPVGGLGAPQAGERLRADGRVVRWRTARQDEVSSTSPFVIEHDTAAAEWTPEDRAARAEERQPFGGRARLAGLEVLAASPAVAAGRLRKLLAAAVEPAGRGVVRVRFGAQEARFAASRPRPGDLVELLADVPLRTKVTRVGDCEIRLRGLPLEAVPSPAPTAGADPHPEAPPDV